MSPSAWPPPSKVRLARHRHRIFRKIEKLLVPEIVLGADPFVYGTIYLPPAHHTGPRGFERVSVVHRDRRLEHVPVRRDLPTFDHMQLPGVRRRVAVHDAELMLFKSDRIDDEFAVLVTTDGFAEPAWRRIGAVLAIKIDAAHMMVALPDDPNLLWRLDEIDGLGNEQQLVRHASWPAARLGHEGAVAGFHFGIASPHPLGRPGHEIGVRIVRCPLAVRRGGTASCGSNLAIDGQEVEPA